MLNKKTVIVVGAGASKEVNLPTGYELKQKIASILNITFDQRGQKISGDDTVCEALRTAIRLKDRNDRNINPLLSAAWRIRDAMPLAISIDNFIDAHQGNEALELCGKLAIVQSILEAERKSSIFVDKRNFRNTIKHQEVNETWLNAFMQILTENCRIDQLRERLSSITFIVFNYDRCIEHFLYHSLQTYYGINAEQAASFVRGIQIYHPYGTVGTLPWYNGTHTVDFGADCSPDLLLDLAGQIKTFTESTDPTSSDITQIRERMIGAHIVMFLGFAFHRINLELIWQPDSHHSSPAAVKYFGTALGISDSNCAVIASDLKKLGGAMPHNIAIRKDLSCYQLLNEFSRSISS